MSGKWTGPIVEPGKGLKAPVNWRALALRAAGMAVVLFGIALYSVFGPVFFEKDDPQDWQVRVVSGLRLEAPAALNPQPESTAVLGLKIERFSDGGNSLEVTVESIRLPLPVRTPEQFFEEEKNLIQVAQKVVKKEPT